MQESKLFVAASLAKMSYRCVSYDSDREEIIHNCTIVGGYYGESRLVTIG